MNQSLVPAGTRHGSWRSHRRLWCGARLQ